MTDRELMQQALDALLEAKDSIMSWGSYASQYFQDKHDLEYDIHQHDEIIEALRARLAQPPKELELPLVRAEEFVKMIEGKEGFRGIPVYRTEWPTPEPEPQGGYRWREGDVPPSITYTAPPQQHSEQWWKHEVSNAFANGYEKGRAKREWQGLTDENISDIQQQFYKLVTFHDRDFARAIEAKLKEKNA